MKKLLSIVAFLALAITAHAQLSFVCDGKEIASGATFATSKCDPTIFEEDGAYAFCPDVSIKSTENANVTVRQVLQSLSNSAMVEVVLLILTLRELKIWRLISLSAYCWSQVVFTRLP